MRCNRRQALGVMGAAAAFPLAMKAQPKSEPEPLPQHPEIITTGFPDLDVMLGGGFRRGELVVVMGSVGSGKTAFCNTVMDHVALSGRRGVMSVLDDGLEPVGFEARARRARKLAEHCRVVNQTILKTVTTNREGLRVHPLSQCPLTLSYVSSVILKLTKQRGSRLVDLEVYKTRYGTHGSIPFAINPSGRLV